MPLTDSEFTQLEEYITQAIALAELTESRAKVEKTDPQRGDGLTALATATVRACDDVRAMAEGLLPSPLSQPDTS